MTLPDTSQLEIIECTGGDYQDNPQYRLYKLLDERAALNKKLIRGLKRSQRNNTGANTEIQAQALSRIGREIYAIQEQIADEEKRKYDELRRDLWSDLSQADDELREDIRKDQNKVLAEHLSSVKALINASKPPDERLIRPGDAFKQVGDLENVAKNEKTTSGEINTNELQRRGKKRKEREKMEEEFIKKHVDSLRDDPRYSHKFRKESAADLWGNLDEEELFRRAPDGSLGKQLDSTVSGRTRLWEVLEQWDADSELIKSKEVQPTAEIPCLDRMQAEYVDDALHWQNSSENPEVSKAALADPSNPADTVSIDFSKKGQDMITKKNLEKKESLISLNSPDIADVVSSDQRALYEFMKIRRPVTNEEIQGLSAFEVADNDQCITEFTVENENIGNQANNSSAADHKGIAKAFWDLFTPLPEAKSADPSNNFGGFFTYVPEIRSNGIPTGGEQLEAVSALCNCFERDKNIPFKRNGQTKIWGQAKAAIGKRIRDMDHREAIGPWAMLF
ncbi:hypothetical protein B0O99DRAFT_688811 [Bisporella sp. PMI_857]|nr:hypothetical protein B0O99DRAFT_688811 [Bisporella sp. PMI_857]